MSIMVALQEGDIDVPDALDRLAGLGGGGVASFTGIVRGGDGLVDLFLEHHPGMTRSAMDAIAGAAMRRWPLLGIELVHRTGVLRPGERIVFVGTAALHRGAALEACAFLIDWLKTRAPFWKCERFDDGRRHWVEPRIADDLAATRWDDGVPHE